MNSIGLCVWMFIAGLSCALAAAWPRVLRAERVNMGASGALAQSRQDLFEARRELVAAQRRRDEMSENERRLKAITDNAPAIVAHLDRDLRYISANEEFRRCLGFDPVALVGRTLRQTRGEAVFAQMESHLAAALGGKTRRFEVTDTIRGVRHDFQHSFVPDLDELGHVRGLYSVAFDVTELRRSRSHLSRTGRVAGIGGWEVDLGTGAVTWSEEVCRIHEVDDGHALSLAEAVAFYAPESRPVIEQAIQLGLANGEAWDLELQLVTATGRTIWVRVLGDTEFANGVAVRLTGALQDIDDRKLAQLAVEQKDTLLRSILQHLPIGMLYVDHAHIVRFINATAERRLGLSPHEGLDQPLQMALGLERYQQQLHPLTRSLLGDHVRVEVERTVDGQRRQFEQRYTPDVRADGKVAGVYMVADDLSIATREVTRHGEAQLARM